MSSSNSERVVPFQSPSAKAAQMALQTLEEWTVIFGESGFGQNLHCLIISLISAIKGGQPEKEIVRISEIVLNEVSMCMEFLTLAVGRHPESNEFRGLAQEIVSIREQAANAATSIEEEKRNAAQAEKQLRSENDQIAKKLTQSEAEKKKLEDRIQSIKQANKEEVSRVVAMLEKFLAEAPRQSGGLAKDLEVIDQRIAQIKQQNQRVEQMMKIMESHRNQATAQAEAGSQIAATMQESVLPMLTAALASEQQSIGLSSIDRAAIEVALGKNQEWLSQLQEQTQSLGEEIETIEARLEELKELAKYGDLEKLSEYEDEKAHLEKQNKRLSRQLTKLGSSEAPVTMKIEELRRYLRAMDTLAAGVPAELLAFDVPKLSDSDGPETGTAEDWEETKKLLTPEQINRREKLVAISKQVALTPAGVLIVTLFDGLPQSAEYKNRKGLIGVIQSARNSGLLQKFGWQNPREILVKWSNENTQVSKYLHYCGQVGGGRIPIFHRTEEKLPWSAYDFCTQEELVAFLKEAADRKKGK